MGLEARFEDFTNSAISAGISALEGETQIDHRFAKK
jgi:hypothetical protein